MAGCGAEVPATLGAGTATDDAKEHARIAAKFCGEGVEEAAVVAELFQSIVDEVVAETGADQAKVECAGLLGIVLNEASRKPDAIFAVRFNGPAAEMDAAFKAGHAVESYEVAEGHGLLFIDVAGAAGGTTTPQALAAQYRITPPSMACLELGLAALEHM